MLTGCVAWKNCSSLSAHTILSLFADQTITSDIFLAGSVGFLSLFWLHETVYLFYH
jgi:hypothetical protein